MNTYIITSSSTVVRHYVHQNYNLFEAIHVYTACAVPAPSKYSIQVR